jgi:hypothetical protein
MGICPKIIMTIILRNMKRPPFERELLMNDYK